MRRFSDVEASDSAGLFSGVEPLLSLLSGPQAVGTSIGAGGASSGFYVYPCARSR